MQIEHSFESPYPLAVALAFKSFTCFPSESALFLETLLRWTLKSSARLQGVTLHKAVLKTRGVTLSASSLCPLGLSLPSRVLPLSLDDGFLQSLLLSCPFSFVKTSKLVWYLTIPPNPIRLTETGTPEFQSIREVGLLVKAADPYGVFPPQT
jgi:hypothetical protein